MTGEAWSTVYSVDGRFPERVVLPTRAVVSWIRSLFTGDQTSVIPTSLCWEQKAVSDRWKRRIEVWLS